jgi:hypothetical protein
VEEERSLELKKEQVGPELDPLVLLFEDMVELLLVPDNQK